MLTTAFTASAWLAVAAFAVVAGGSVVIFGCWPASSSRRAAHWLMTGSLTVLMASTLATLLLQGPTAQASAAGGLGRRESWLGVLRATLATRSGHAQELRLLVLALGAIALAAWWSKLEGSRTDVGSGGGAGGRGDRRIAGAAWLMITVLLAATWPVSDEGTGARRWLPEAANIASLSAICVAAGGLITLALLLASPRSRPRRSPSQAATDQARADRPASDQAASDRPATDHPAAPAPAPTSTSVPLVTAAPTSASRWESESRSASTSKSASTPKPASASGWEPASPGTAAMAVRRFATVAMGCVVVLAISGGYQAWRNAGGPADPANAGILRLRAAGIAIVLLLGLGAWAWIRFKLTARHQPTAARPRSIGGIRRAHRPTRPRPRTSLTVLALTLTAAIGTSAFVVAPPALSSTSPSIGANTAARQPSRLTSGSPTVVPQLLQVLGCG